MILCAYIHNLKYSVQTWWRFVRYNIRREEDERIRTSHKRFIATVGLGSPDGLVSGPDGSEAIWV